MSGRNPKSTLPDGKTMGMSKHFNMRFTTYDRDQDINDIANCATYKTSRRAGWWYHNCYSVN